MSKVSVLGELLPRCLATVEHDVVADDHDVAGRLRRLNTFAEGPYARSLGLPRRKDALRVGQADPRAACCEG